jgi:hypothetical protein
MGIAERGAPQRTSPPQTPSARLEVELKERQKLQSQMERRLQQLEETVRDRQGAANAELVAKLQRAEAELAGRKAPRS